MSKIPNPSNEAAKLRRQAEARTNRHATFYSHCQNYEEKNND